MIIFLTKTGLTRVTVCCHGKDVVFDFIGSWSTFIAKTFDVRF